MRGRREGDYLLKNRNLPLCRLFCHFSYRKPPFSPAKLAIFIFKSSLFLSFFFPDGSTGKRLLTICNLSFRPEIPPLFFLHKACFREEHTKNMLKEKKFLLGEPMEQREKKEAENNGFIFSESRQRKSIEICSKKLFREGKNFFSFFIRRDVERKNGEHG
ncbi:MAG: hypothetical protein J5814_04665 [Bacteroidaceae bacterium]|nr:hypothetical protein [Bacteroidaceae bacterium]